MRFNPGLLNIPTGSTGQVKPPTPTTLGTDDAILGPVPFKGMEEAAPPPPPPSQTQVTDIPPGGAGPPEGEPQGIEEAVQAAGEAIGDPEAKKAKKGGGFDIKKAGAMAGLTAGVALLFSKMSRGDISFGEAVAHLGGGALKSANQNVLQQKRMDHEKSMSRLKAANAQRDQLSQIIAKVESAGPDAPEEFKQMAVELKAATSKWDSAMIDGKITDKEAVELSEAWTGVYTALEKFDRWQKSRDSTEASERSVDAGLARRYPGAIPEGGLGDRAGLRAGAAEALEAERERRRAKEQETADYRADTRARSEASAARAQASAERSTKAAEEDQKRRELKALDDYNAAVTERIQEDGVFLGKLKKELKALVRDNPDKAPTRDEVQEILNRHRRKAADDWKQDHAYQYSLISADAMKARTDRKLTGEQYRQVLEFYGTSTGKKDSKGKVTRSLR